MPDEIVTQVPQLPPPPRNGGLSRMVIVVLLAFAIGFGTAGWIGWKSGADWGGVLTGHGDRARTAANGGNGGGATPAVVPALGSMESRVAALELRLSMLDRQANAAAGNTGRAEALLVAFAARRAVERGAPLGYLEDQLKLRFGDALPNAAATVINGARNPVTLDQLALGLNEIGAQVTSGAAGETGWEKLRRGVSGLFVIHDERPANAPTDSSQRLAQARILLREGRTGDAINAVRALGTIPHGSEWIASAQRYQDLQRALDLLETTALLEPRELKDGAGNKVAQPSPLAAEAAASR